MSRKPKVVLIDSHALIHRAYHALPPMTTRDGKHTQAVYGFVTMLLKVFTTLKPTHVVAAFDVGGATFRHEEFADYKAHRGPAEDDLVEQFDRVREVVRAFNIPVLEQPGFEADDVIGTLVAKIGSRADKIIVTGDMDTLQLVDEATSVFTLKRGITDTTLYTPAQVQEKYGFGPDYVTDYKGLRGDPSDNIPGVAGIGDKTARDLVSQYGHIENIYEHFDELPKRAQTRLSDKQEEAFFSRKLATIRQDMEFEFDLDEAALHDFSRTKVVALFNELEFKSLLSKIPVSTSAASAPSQPRPRPDHYHVADTTAQVAKLQEKLRRVSVTAFDVENEALGARRYPIVGMSFAFLDPDSNKVEAWYVPTTATDVVTWKEILESRSLGKIGHNLKYDIEVLAQSGVRLQPVTFDTMLASYLLQPGARQHSLDTLALQELGHTTIPITELIGSGKQQLLLSKVPVDQLAHYACEDADVAWRLYERFAPKLQDEGLARVFEELEVPLVTVLADMELCGVYLDTDKLTALEKKASKQLADLTVRIHEAASEEFNINSPNQLREILFEKLSLPTVGINRTKSGYSTAASELAKLAGTHEIIELIEQYRELSKLLSTYIKALPEQIDPRTQRIHASFNQTVTATGRLSSTDPNLQNIPVRTELGQKIRAAFAAPPKKKFVKADYSQLELRLAAHLSRDEKMVDAFRQGADIHQQTAAWVNHCDPEEVTDEQRRAAKALNFGVLYGMGPQSFARSAGISLEEARSFVERYQDQYQGLMSMMAETVEQARELGFVETMFGRRRYVPEINAGSPALRAAAERAAFNFPIQGTNADILKKAMIELHGHIAQAGASADLILTVHDELVCEVAEDEVFQFAEEMRRLMQNTVTLDVPLLVDVATGPNWSELTSL